MEKIIHSVALTIGLMVLASVSFAETKIFDTITAYQAGKDNAWVSPIYESYFSITGFEKDSGENITVNFGGYSYDKSGNAASQICTPLVLTAMEKPGRYYLHVTWDEVVKSVSTNQQVTSCMLELKSIPE